MNRNKNIIVECGRKRYFRPVEVDYLKGNSSKAKNIKMVTKNIY